MLTRLPGETDEAFAARCRLEETSRVLGTVFRDLQINSDAIISEDERLVRVSFSSEKPVLRNSWFEKAWVEILGHDDGEVNLSRLNSKASVHYNHSRSRADRVGVVESGSLKGKRGEAMLRFSKRPDVDDVWQDVRDGVLTNVSVGYSIDERKLVRATEGEGPDEYRVTRWTPHEISFVDIPADHTVGLGRNVDAGYMVRSGDNGEPFYRIETTNQIQLSPQGNTMLLQRREGETDADFAERQRLEDIREAAEVAARATPTPTPAAPTPAPTPAPSVDLDAERETARAQGVAAETARRSGIEAMLRPFHNLLGDRFDAIRTHCVDGSGDNPTPLELDNARAYVMDQIGQGQVPTGGDPSDVRVLETERESWHRGCIASLQLRAGLIDRTSEAGREVIKDSVSGYSLREMARRYLELEGVNTQRLGVMDLVGRAFSSSDFPLLLQDAANKTMLKGFEESEETWSNWAQVGNLSDFKIGNRPGLSSFDDLQIVSENGEFVYGSFTEQRNTIQLATYGKLFAITRQAIINDDLSAFTVIPSRMGRAAARLVGDLAYGVITTNAAIGDGIALFNAAHNNLNEGGAAVITAASFGAARNAMGLQTDASGSAVGLNIQPAHFLVPLALRDTASVLMRSTFDPAQMAGQIPNPVAGQAVVTSDPRLDADSVTRWYLAASAIMDTIEVAFLDGVQAPVLEQQQGWTIDGTEYKVRIDVGAAAMEFRTWQRNDGV